MRTEADPQDLLALVQWLSPAFPVGGFAFSHGLETAVASGDVADASGFADWLGAMLDLGAGWSDAVILSLAHRDAHPLDDLAAIALAMATGRERARESAEQGAAFLRTTNALLGTTHPPLPLPVAVGLQARRLALPTVTVGALYLQAFAGNLCTIAARIVPLGQTAAQAALAQAAPAIAALADRAANADLADLGGSAFRGDLAALRHETQDVRLFQS